MGLMEVQGGAAEGRVVVRGQQDLRWETFIEEINNPGTGDSFLTIFFWQFVRQKPHSRVSADSGCRFTDRVNLNIGINSTLQFSVYLRKTNIL